ncbi:MAG: alpha-galactosidase [Candidatus Latescibacterota bacterium]
MSPGLIAAGADPEVALNSHWADQVFSARPTGRPAGDASLPFSFVYGGKHSSEFINDWNREIQDKRIGDTTNLRILTLTDPATGLEVKVECQVYQDTAGVDWTLFFTNKGNKDSPVIEQVKAVDASFLLGEKSEVVLHRLKGSPCAVDDWMPFDQPLPMGQAIEFATTDGRSSNVSPWFNVASSNSGVITAIGWSGQWCASVESRDGQICIQAGMQNLHAVLHPGETIRSPRILQLQWQGGDVLRACNLFRRTMFAHIMVRINGQLVVPPMAHLSTSFYELNASDEQNVLSHLESVRGLGFEMFWLDAYWTGPSGFPNSMGNYGFPIERVEPKDRFPHGLSAIGDAVEKEGLRFVLWFEPERVAAGTFIAKEHPEWVISPSGDGGGLFNLGIPAARQYMTDYLNAAIKAYKVACLRIDYNIDPLGFWTFVDAKDPSRAGMTEMRCVEGLYRMWDDILQANPSLFIDNCASGGRRIDIETMSRSVPLWRSDNTCDMLDKKPGTILLAALKNQVMSAGLNRYVPFSTVGQMGATPYFFRSGFNAGIAFVEDVRPRDYPRDLLRQGVAEGKRIRKYYFGNFYPLVEVTASPRDWCVLQYHRPGDRDGMVMAFRRQESPDGTCEVRLREIDPAADYRVTMYRTYEPETPLTIQGAALQRLTLGIAESPGSLLMEYVRK